MNGRTLELIIRRLKRVAHFLIKKMLELDYYNRYQNTVTTARQTVLL